MGPGPFPTFCPSLLFPNLAAKICLPFSSGNDGPPLTGGTGDKPPCMALWSGFDKAMLS